VRAQGEDTPSEPESSGEDEDREEGKVTPPPHSLPCEALPLLGDIISRQAGIALDVHRLK
jgi:hypothetical protein